MELHSHCVTFDRRMGRTGLKFGELLAPDGLLIDTKFQVNRPVTSVVITRNVAFFAKKCCSAAELSILIPLHSEGSFKGRELR